MRWPRDVFEIFSPKLEDLPVEEFHVAILDSQHRLERDVTITRGLLNSSLVHPREAFRAAICMNASGVFFVHNHPTGDLTPSREDRAVTERLRKCGEILGINLIDHIIVGHSDGEWKAISMSEV